MMTIDELLKEKYVFAFFMNGRVDLFFDTNHNYRYENWDDVIPISIEVNRKKIHSVVHRCHYGFVIGTTDGNIHYPNQDESLEQLLERITK